jgi:hypothetical protein
MEVAPELRGKVLAFVGDNTTFSAPHPVILPEHNAWEQKRTAMCNNAIAAALFYADMTKSRKLWNPPATNRTNVSLP